MAGAANATDASARMAPADSINSLLIAFSYGRIKRLKFYSLSLFLAIFCFESSGRMGAVPLPACYEA
jgi:hypothetical protein